MPERRQSFTYSRLKKALASVAPRKTKRILLNTYVSAEGDNMLITFQEQYWHRDKPDDDWQKKRREYRLATVSPDNVLTFEIPSQLMGSQSINNRIKELIGWTVANNKRDYSRHAQTVRVYNKPSWTDSDPFFGDSKWDLYTGQWLNRKPDLITVVKNEAIAQVKAEFGPLRKFMLVSKRMGAFNEYANHALATYNWAAQMLKSGKVKAITDVNYKDPDFEDALAVLVVGMTRTSRPNSHALDKATGRYLPVPEDERREVFLKRAIEAGMQKLRERYYTTNDGYDKVAA